MNQDEQFFIDSIFIASNELQNIAQEQFDNPTDFIFKKAALEGEIAACRNAQIEFRKTATESSSESATIMIYRYCKIQSDNLRIDLGKTENQENQENEQVISERGRLNGLIDGYNKIRVHYSILTSEHAANRERANH